MQWINNTDVQIEPDEQITFRQVGWIGITGSFYSMIDGAGWCEKGGFAPVFVKLEVKKIKDKRPCKGKNSNICVAEGCFGQSCLEI